LTQEFTDIFKKLISDNGIEVLDDTRNCRALLSDYACGEYKRDIDLLAKILEKNFHKRLEKCSDREIEKKRLAKQMYEDFGFDIKLAYNVISRLSHVLFNDSLNLMSVESNETQEAMEKAKQEAESAKREARLAKLETVRAKQEAKEAKHEVEKAKHKAETIIKISTTAIILLIVFVFIVWFSWSSKPVTSITQGTFTDSRDGKKYKTVKIGTQIWMAENLNYNPGTGNSACYENKPVNCDKYGMLYNWNIAMNVCPNGWHLPNNGEWDILYSFVDKTYNPQDLYKLEDGTIYGFSNTAGKHLKAKSNWKDDKDKSGNGEDTYGFSALPGGFGYLDGDFFNADHDGYWWSSNEHYSDNAYDRNIYYGYDYARWYSHSKNYLFSVRCLKD